MISLKTESCPDRRDELHLLVVMGWWVRCAGLECSYSATSPTLARSSPESTKQWMEITAQNTPSVLKNMEIYRIGRELSPHGGFDTSLPHSTRPVAEALLLLSLKFVTLREN